jgi:hypothetical protein
MDGNSVSKPTHLEVCVKVSGRSRADFLFLLDLLHSFLQLLLNFYYSVHFEILRKTKFKIRFNKSFLKETSDIRKA